MARYELKLPSMGESVAEAVVTNWLKKVGDPIEAEEAIVEVATDKVDSEVPSEVSGIVSEILFKNRSGDGYHRNPRSSRCLSSSSTNC